MELFLARVAYHPDGTFGVLLVQEAPLMPLTPIATTCEEVWAFNQRNASCIPSGRYRCDRVLSPKFGNTFEVKEVYGRDAILFHKGNTVKDTEGCILIGETFSLLDGVVSIGDSGKGFEEFLTLTAELDHFNLTVQDRTAG